MDKTKASGFVGSRHQDDEPHLIQEIIRTHQVLLAELTRRTGVKSSRFAVMRLLADADADVGVMELARQLGINAAAVTRQVQELESEALVRRRADPNDGRRTGIRLSPKGRRLMGELLECSRGFEQVLSSALSAKEMAGAAAALNKLRTFVEGLR
ncbi:MAG: MarR family transcriptional regulator [Actinobacteria bacterium]|nr:MarR family transcriptional regulator [Actinomycetota bacterium]